MKLYSFALSRFVCCALFDLAVFCHSSKLFIVLTIFNRNNLLL